MIYLETGQKLWGQYKQGVIELLLLDINISSRECLGSSPVVNMRFVYGIQFDTESRFNTNTR